MQDDRTNESYEAVVILEEAQTKLQLLLKSMITDFLTRQLVGANAKNIINDCIEKLKTMNVDNSFIEKARNGLQGTFISW